MQAAKEEVTTLNRRPRCCVTFVSADAPEQVWSNAMRITVRPMLDPQREIDLTERLVAAIAGEISRTCGGNDQLNWIEAESHLRQLVSDAKAERTRDEDLVSPRMRSMHGTPTSPIRTRVGTSAAGRWAAENRMDLSSAQPESQTA
jgi:hypothetical protein